MKRNKLNNMIYFSNKEPGEMLINKAHIQINKYMSCNLEEKQ